MNRCVWKALGIYGVEDLSALEHENGTGCYCDDSGSSGS